MLQCLEPSEPKKQLPFMDSVNVPNRSVCVTALKIINIADTIIASVNQTTLLTYLGTKADLEPDAAKTKV